jgi:predicted nucleic-acid-binding Zn-ribbon protein
MITLKERVAGGIPTSKEIRTAIYSKYFSNNSDQGKTLFRTVGCIEDGEIKGWMALLLNETKSRGKYWAIIAFYGKEFSNYFDMNSPVYGKLVRYAIDFCEDLGYNEFYYAITERVMNAYERQWKRSKFRSERYGIETVEIIPPHTKPEVDLYWRLIGERLRDETMVIKRRMLRDNQSQK